MVVAQGHIYRPDVGLRATNRRPPAWGRREARAGRGGLCLAPFLGLALLAVTLGLTVSAGFVSIAAQGYHLCELRQELAALERDGGRLEVEVARLGSVARVAQIASGRLALAAPRPGFYARVPAAAPAALALGEGGGVTAVGGAGPSPGWAVGRVALASGVSVSGRAEAAASGGAPAPAPTGGWGTAPAAGDGRSGVWAALFRWLPGLRHAEAHPVSGP